MKIAVTGLFRAALPVWALFFLAACSTPQAPSPPPPPRNINVEVRAEFTRSLEGWNTGNLDVFLSIYAEGASFALKDNFLVGYNSIRSYYAPQFAPGAAHGTLSFPEFDVKILCLDVVLVRAIYENAQPGKAPVWGTSTLLLQFRDGHWRVIHDQST